MKANPHIIGRQIIDLNLNTADGASEIQAEISRIFHEQITPELDRMFSELIPPDVFIRLDRLELELGDIGSGEIEQLLPARVSKAIKEKVVSFVQKQQVRYSGEEEDLLALSYSQRTVELAIFYLRTGNLPWWTEKDLTLFELKEELNRLLKEQATGILPQLWKVLERREAVTRLVAQFGEETIAILSSSVSPTLNADLNLIIEAIDSIIRERDLRFVPIKKNAKWFTSLVEKFQELSVRSDSVENVQLAVTSHLVRTLIQLNPTTKKEAWTSLWQGLERSSEIKALADGLQAELLHSLSDFNKEDDPQALVKNEKVIEKNIEALISKGAHSERQSLEDNGDSQLQDLEWLKDGILIENAGLVIVAPYLPGFFKAIGLLQGIELIDSQQAIYILQYLATGSAEADEFEMGLNKILSGMEITDPIEFVGWEPEEEVKEEANTMLRAVVNNWSALKGSSIDGLREGFLRREGRLSFDGETWHLNVEQKTLDILLGRLPWSISVIKLPWMQQMIRVDWV